MSTRRLSIADLYDDVLSVIVTFLSPRDALQLSCTTRSVHHVAMRQVLSSVIIRNSRDVLTICPYLLADVHSRLHHVQKLEIEEEVFVLNSSRRSNATSSCDIHCVCALLADVLEGCRNLRSLYLPRAEILLHFRPDVAESFASLRLDILSIHLTASNDRALAVFQNSTSKSKRLYLSSSIEMAEPEAFLSGISGNENLQALTLVQLTCSRTRLALPQTQTLTSLETVHELHFIRCSELHIPTLVHIFPNVRKLVVTGNSQYQLQSDLRTCWTALNHLEGNLQALTAWPIAGHVHHLKVDPEQPFFPGLPYESSISLIQRVSPVRLSFTIGTRVGLSFWTNVVDSVPRLRILEVDLLETFYTPDLGVMHLEPWMNSTIPLLNPFSAVYFEIQINIAHSRPSVSHSCAWQSMAALVGAIPSIIAHNIPSVRIFALRVRNRAESSQAQAESLPPLLAAHRGERKTANGYSNHLDAGEHVRLCLCSPSYDWTVPFDDTHFFRQPQHDNIVPTLELCPALSRGQPVVYSGF